MKRQSVGVRIISSSSAAPDGVFAMSFPETPSAEPTLCRGCQKPGATPSLAPEFLYETSKSNKISSETKKKQPCPFPPCARADTPAVIMNHLVRDHSLFQRFLCPGCNENVSVAESGNHLLTSCRGLPCPECKSIPPPAVPLGLHRQVHYYQHEKVVDYLRSRLLEIQSLAQNPASVSLGRLFALAEGVVSVDLNYRKNRPMPIFLPSEIRNVQKDF